MTPKAESLMVGSLLFGLIVFIGIAIYLDSGRQEQVSQESIRCAEAGGVYLDRTYSYGKNNTGHLYTCVDKKMVIQEL